MPIYRFQQFSPTIAQSTFIAETAVLIGKVSIAKGVSIWFGAVLRGDNELISIGENSNIQENSVLHTDIGCPLTVARHVTIGHSVTLHGCTIGDNSLVGMGATILNHAVIGKNSIVGAGALITEHKTFPDDALIIGNPAKMVRLLTTEEIKQLAKNAEHYVARGQEYCSSLSKIDQI